MNRIIQDFAAASAVGPAGAAPAVEIAVAGVAVACDHLGVLYMPADRILVVSDLHLEKGSAFARRGMMLPPYDTGATLKLLAIAIARYRPATVISLGDSFHDRVGAAHMPEPFRSELLALQKGRAWFWIAGNHDPDVPADLPGDAVEAIAAGGLMFRHEPSPQRLSGEVAGHLHPSARVVRRGKGVRRACFATDGDRLVMPAFGVLTGGLDLNHRALSQLFDRARLTAHILGKDRIYSVARANLVA